MQTMTYIAIIQDKDFNQISFERFSCKRLQTVKENMLKLFSNSLYKACTPGAAAVAVYKTPDGYNKEEYPCMCFNVKGV